MATDFNFHFTSYADAIGNYITASPCLENWPECRRLLLKRVAQEPDWGLALPVLSCLAVSGSAEQAIPVSAAWFALRLASELFDDFHDEEALQTEEKTSQRITVQFSPGLIFSAFQFVNQAYEPLIASQITSVFSEAGFKSNIGYLQILSKSYQEYPLNDALAAYWQAVILKSGSIYRAGMAGGAIAGNAPSESKEALSEYGTSVGVILQILDDCRDVLSENPDIDLEVSLPILLYSLKVRNKGVTKEKIFRPGVLSRQQLIRKLKDQSVPLMLTKVLEKWRDRARLSLESIEANESKRTLEALLDVILSE